MARQLGYAAIILASACSAASPDEAPRRSHATTSNGLSLVGKVLDYGDQCRGLEGVEVCASNLGCSLTGEEGYAFHGLSPSSMLRLSFKKPGYLPSIVDVRLGASSSSEDGLLLAAPFIEKLGRSVEAELPAETGGVLFTAYMLDYNGLLPLSGVSVAIREQQGALSVYLDERGEPIRGETKTLAPGWGVALGVRPGRVVGEVTHELAGASCGPLHEDLMELTSRFDAEVVAGTLTRVSVICVYAG